MSGMSAKSCGLKLNLGASHITGEYQKETWVNLDLQKFERRNSKRFVVGTGLALPFRGGAFTEVRAIHVLEHVRRQDHATFLAEVLRVLSPAGKLIVEVPNFYEVSKAIVRLGLLETPEAQEELRCMTLSVYGKGRYLGDFHHWGFTTLTLSADLAAAGFSRVQFSGYVSHHYWQEPVISLAAYKPPVISLAAYKP